MGTVEWVVLAILAFVVGAGAGFGLANTGRRREAAKFNEVEKELEDYKARVNQHFEQAATHFQAIGEQYRALYEHMAEGSQALCSGEQASPALKFPKPDEVTPHADPKDAEDGDEAVAMADDAEPAERDEAPDAGTDSEPHAGKTEEARPALSGEQAEGIAVDEDGKPRLYH